jgi:hypothetical protein
MTNPFAAPGQVPAQPAPQPQWQQPAAPQQYAQPQQTGNFYNTPQNAQEAAQYQPPAPPMTGTGSPNQENTADFFGGAASISFADPATKGQARGGVVLSKAVTQRTNMQTGQPEFWPNNQPKMQLAVTLQTAERADPQDDGKRTLFVKSHMVKAVKTALGTAGVPDLEIGGLLLVAWVDDKPSKTPGFGAAKIFAAQYQRPGSFDPSPYQQGQPGGPRVAPVPPAPAQPQAPVQQYPEISGAGVPHAQPQTGGFNPFG